MNLRDSSLASPNVMTYYPRVCLSERSGRVQTEVPACGVVAGLLCQNDQAGVWRGLAGGDVQLKAGLSVAESLTERQIKMLLRDGVNLFSRNDHGTVELLGDVTLAGSRLVSQIWRRLDRRRLAFFILASVERHTSWAAARPRDDNLWRDLTAQVRTFLTELFEQGALAGRTAAQAFSVKTGPAMQEDSSELVLRIGFALERAGEFQIYDVVHREDGSTTRPAVALEVAQLTG